MTTSMKARIAAGISVAAVAGTILAVAGSASAQSYPSKPIRIVVGAPAGASSDTIARYFADRIKDATSQPVIVDNRAGAAGNIGASAVAKSAPDGYTILLGPNSTIAANMYLFKQLGFDPVKDFTPVTTMVRIVSMLVVSPSTTPVTDAAGLTQLLRKAPDKYSFGSGNASSHIAGQLYLSTIGAQAVHVPYKSVLDMVNDMLGGRIHFSVLDLATALPQVRSGKLRGLGVTSAERVSIAPEIPSLAEAGVKGYEFTGWFGLFMPAGTPPAAVNHIAAIVQASLKLPATAEYVGKLGMVTFPNSPEATRDFVQAEIVRWGRVVKLAGIQPE